MIGGSLQLHYPKQFGTCSKAKIRKEEFVTTTSSTSMKIRPGRPKMRSFVEPKYSSRAWTQKSKYATEHASNFGTKSPLGRRLFHSSASRTPSTISQRRPAALQALVMSLGKLAPMNTGLNGRHQGRSLKTDNSQTEETCPSASTTNDGLCTKSQRKPSGSATQALLPPHGCTVGSVTEVAPASSARR